MGFCLNKQASVTQAQCSDVTLGHEGQTQEWSIPLTFLGSVEEGPVLGSVADFNDLRSGEELHDHAGCDDGGDAELHQCASIRSKDDTDPVERIRGVGGHDPE